MSSRDELECIKLEAEIANLTAIRQKTEAEYRNLLPARTAHRLQKVQPWISVATVVASLIFATVTWINADRQLRAKDQTAKDTRGELAAATASGSAAVAQHTSVPQVDEWLDRLQTEVKGFEKEPFDLGFGLKIQDWPTQPNAVELPTVSEDPLKALREPFNKAAKALFALPEGKWATREFFEMLKLCRQDRRYVGMLVNFALSEENKKNEAGWLYAALVFRNIAFEDSQKSPERLREYADALLPFLDAALSRSPQVRGQAKDIYDFLPKQYRRPLG